MKIIEKTFNALTGEETITERNATVEEIAERESAIAEAEAKAQANAAKAHERAALLDKLGITAEEAQLLLGGN
jgi:hypothetical protein